MSLGLAAAQIAPLYNLGLVLVAFFLFFKLFSIPVKDKRVTLLPWKFLFFAVIVFVVEEVITILRFLDVINIPIHINGFFELIIIISFLHMIFVQKDHMKRLQQNTAKPAKKSKKKTKKRR